MKSLLTWLILPLLLARTSGAFELPKNCQQVIVGTTETWDSSWVSLQLFEKNRGTWQAHGPAWKGRLGKAGLVWGRGIHPLPPRAKLKREGDKRAPAGIFRLGDVWGYAKMEPVHPKLRYHQITTRDLWVEDSQSPHYNQHLQLRQAPQTDWQKRQQMRQNDPPHSLKLFIKHNAENPIQPGAGSAIFFHIWRRNGKAATAGCTTMPEAKLRSLVQWINPSKNPLYILLPKSEYTRYRKDWKLP